MHIPKKSKKIISLGTPTYIRPVLRPVRGTFHAMVELRHLEPFTKVQKLFTINTAQLANYTQIAVEAGVSSKTVQRCLEYMSIGYQTLVLQAWSRNPKKRLVKSPKVHYLDVGVMRAINKDLSLYHLRTADGR